jgi:excisionase family DNA binding protein
MPLDNPREVLTVQETATTLGISLNSAYEGIRRGEIPHLRIGRRIVVPVAALERVLATAGQ